MARHFNQDLKRSGTGFQDCGKDHRVGGEMTLEFKSGLGLECEKEQKLVHYIKLKVET